LFLVGIGRLGSDGFRLKQFFMRDPFQEPAHLEAIEEFLAPCQGLVTFNGKAFDLPLLNGRFIAQGLTPPFTQFAHIDLLHLSRRLWSERLASRTLANLEAHILGIQRTEEDIPGWMIPSLYYDYLREADARPLKRVFYHNAMDVISMVALFNRITNLLADPINDQDMAPGDFNSLAKLYMDIGKTEQAITIYLASLDRDLPETALLSSLVGLAGIYKKQQETRKAIPLWEMAAQRNHLDAHIELAKYYEHQMRDYPTARYWTQTAIDLLILIDLSMLERNQWEQQLHHRLARLARKQAGHIDDYDSID
jgi:hypothetical protein